MYKKMIALDIDGTLFDSHGRISNRTLRAIRNCTEQGIYVVFATGRDYSALPLLQVEGCGIQFAVTTNGSAIYGLDHKNCIWEETMTNRDIQKILEYGIDKQLFVFLFIDGIGYAQQDQYPLFQQVDWPAHLKNETTAKMQLVDDLGKFIEMSSRGVQKGAILFPHMQGGIDQAWNETRTFFETISAIHAVDGGCENLEFNHVNATKASGLKHLCRMLQIEMKDVIAIGDSENDLEMLAMAGVGVAMGNAGLQVKQSAGYVTASNDDDGVARVLEKILQN